MQSGYHPMRFREIPLGNATRVRSQGDHRREEKRSIDPQPRAFQTAQKVFCAEGRGKGEGRGGERSEGREKGTGYGRDGISRTPLSCAVEDLFAAGT